jgi:hypothetical protein
VTDDNRMPNFWWCLTHHLYRGGDKRPCADAVRLVPAPPAPRVFLPGDTVPAGTAVMLDDGSLVEGAATDERWDINDGPVVELLGVPTREEWQAAVDRARAEREEALRADRHAEITEAEASEARDD